MANEQKSIPLVIEIPVPWSDRPIVVKTSFWLAVVLAILIMAFAAAYMWDWDINQIIGQEPAPVVTPVTNLDGVTPHQA